MRRSHAAPGPQTESVPPRHVCNREDPHAQRARDVGNTHVERAPLALHLRPRPLRQAPPGRVPAAAAPPAGKLAPRLSLRAGHAPSVPAPIAVDHIHKGGLVLLVLLPDGQPVPPLHHRADPVVRRAHCQYTRVLVDETVEATGVAQVGLGAHAISGRDEIGVGKGGIPRRDAADQRAGVVRPHAVHIGQDDVYSGPQHSDQGVDLAHAQLAEARLVAAKVRAVEGGLGDGPVQAVEPLPGALVQHLLVHRDGEDGRTDALDVQHPVAQHLVHAARSVRHHRPVAALHGHRRDTVRVRPATRTGSASGRAAAGPGERLRCQPQALGQQALLVQPALRYRQLLPQLADKLTISGTGGTERAAHEAEHC
eukprot:scaffold2635_cov106-Isochrysis_galbana.AAC.5